MFTSYFLKFQPSCQYESERRHPSHNFSDDNTNNFVYIICDERFECDETFTCASGRYECVVTVEIWQ